MLSKLSATALVSEDILGYAYSGHRPSAGHIRTAQIRHLYSWDTEIIWA